MSIQIQKNCIDGNLLPPIAKVEFKKAKALSKIITELADQALTAFVNKQLSEFDAPVGDNSCKIRAAKIACIADRFNNEPSFGATIKQLRKELDVIRKRIDTLQPSRERLSLKEFRNKHEIEFSLDPDLEFLILSFFLHFVKHPDGYERTDHSRLQRIAPLANSAAKNWIHLIKKQLANRSVQFVRVEAKKIANGRSEILQKMLSDNFIETHLKKQIVPNFHSMEVLFTKALEKNRRIIFKDGKEMILFQPNEKHTTFIPKNVQQEDLNKPAIVIEGEIIDRDLFDRGDFFKLLLARAAQDPQFLGGKWNKSIRFTPLVQKEKEYFEAQNKVPVPFDIHHILCDRVGNLLGVR